MAAQHSPRKDEVTSERINRVALSYYRRSILRVSRSNCFCCPGTFTLPFTEKGSFSASTLKPASQESSAVKLPFLPFGTLHVCLHVKPHPYSRLTVSTSFPAASSIRSVGGAGRE